MSTRHSVSRSTSRLRPRARLLHFILSLALTLGVQASPGQTFADRAFVGQWNAQSPSNRKLALASAEQLQVIGERLAPIQFPRDLLASEISGKAFVEFIESWAGSQRCSGTRGALCVDLIAMAPYVLAAAKSQCAKAPCTLGPKAAEVVDAAMKQVMEDRILEAKLNLVLEYSDEVQRIVPGFDEFSAIRGLLNVRTSHLMQGIQCADSSRNCSDKSVNDFSAWLLAGLARSDAWRTNARGILERIDGRLKDFEAMRAAVKTAASELRRAPDLRTAFPLHSASQGEFSLVAIPALFADRTETEVFLSTGATLPGKDICGDGTCRPLGLICLNAELKGVEPEDRDSKGGQAGSFRIERSKQAGLDCRRDADKLARTLVDLGLPEPIAALALPYDLRDGSNPTLEVRFAGSVRIGNLDLPIDEKLVFPGASSKQLAALGDSVVGALNARLRDARPTLNVGGRKVGVQDLCLATSTVSCSSGVARARSGQLLLMGGLSVPLAGESTIIRFSAALSPSTGRIELGELRPELGPKTLESLVDVVRAWFKVDKEAQTAFRSVLQVGVAAYDQAQRRVILPITVRVAEREARAEIAFSILEGLTKEDFERQVAASFTNIVKDLQEDVRQRVEQLKEQAADVATSAACNQVKTLTAGLQGAVGVHCNPFYLTAGDDIKLDGLRLVDQGRTIDHSGVHVYRGGTREFDANVVHDLVRRITNLPPSVLQFPRPPVRTVDGIVLSPAVWIAPAGAAFEVGEICIGISGRCKSHLADLRKIVDRAIMKAVVERGNAWIQAHSLDALGPVSSPKLEPYDNDTKVRLTAKVQWGGFISFDAMADVYPRFDFQEPKPDLAPAFNALLAAAGTKWVKVKSKDPLELELHLKIAGAIAKGPSLPAAIDVTVNRNGVKAPLMVPINFPGSYGPFWMVWANGGHIDIDLLDPLRFAAGTTLALEANPKAVVSMPTTITVDLKQQSMRIKGHLDISSVALFEVSGGVSLSPLALDLRARSTDVIRKVLDFDNRLDYVDPRLTSNGKLAIFGFRVSSLDLSLEKNGSGTGSAEYGLLGTTFKLRVETEPGLFPKTIAGEQSIHIAGIRAQLGFTAGLDALQLRLKAPLVSASATVPSIKSVTPEFLASLLLVGLDLDLQSLVNALRNVDDMHFAFSGSFGVGDRKHNAKGSHGANEAAGGPSATPPAPPVGQNWKGPSHPQAIPCPNNQPWCLRLDSRFVYLAHLGNYRFLAVPLDKRAERSEELTIHLPGPCARTDPPPKCWTQHPAKMQLGEFLDNMAGQPPANCALRDIACVFGRPGVPELYNHPQLEVSARHRFEWLIEMAGRGVAVDKQVDEPLFLYRTRDQGPKDATAAPPPRLLAVFRIGSAPMVFLDARTDKEVSEAMNARVPLRAPVAANLERIFMTPSIASTADRVLVRHVDYIGGSTLAQIFPRMPRPAAAGLPMGSPAPSGSLILLEPEQAERNVQLWGPPAAEEPDWPAVARTLRRAEPKELAAATVGPLGLVLMEKRGAEYRLSYFRGAHAVCGVWITPESLRHHLSAQRRSGQPPLAPDMDALVRELVWGSPSAYSVAPYVSLTKNGGGECRRG